MATCAPYVSGPPWLAGRQSPGTFEYASTEALRREVERGDPFGISCCAARGVDLNCLWKDGCGPPVVEAASRGHLLALRRLLELGANVAGTNAAGYSAMMAACSQGHDLIVEELVRQPQAVSLISAATAPRKNTSGVTPRKLAEQRLASAKAALSTAKEACCAAARQCDADTWLFARKVFDADVISAEAELTRCKRICEHLEAVMLEEVLGPARPAHKHVTFDGTMGTASVLGAAALPQEGRANLPAGDQEEDNSSAFPLDFWNSISGGEQVPYRSLARSASAGSLVRPARVDSLGGHSFTGPQKVPHSSGLALTAAMLTRVRTRKRALTTKSTYRPQKEPPLLTAVRSLSVEQSNADSPRSERLCGQSGAWRHPVSSPF